MPLDNIKRGALERFIDNVVNSTPEHLRQFRDKESKQYFHIQNENDFVYGYVVGGIIYGFLVANPDKLTEDEFNEVQLIIARRAKEIRDAIFNAG